MIGTNQATAEVGGNTERENGRIELTAWEAARMYDQAGYKPIPLKPGTKQPRGEGLADGGFQGPGDGLAPGIVPGHPSWRRASAA